MKKTFKAFIVALCLITISENVKSQSALGLSFDGVDDRVTIPFHANYNLSTGPFIVEAWIKADATQPFAEPTIFSNREAVNGNTGIQVFLSNGKLRVRIGGTLSNAMGNDLRDNTCHHIAIQRSNIAYFYVDGILVGTHTGLGQSVNSTHAIWVGSDEPTAATSRFKGVIHELRLWTLPFSSFINNRYSYLNGNEYLLRGCWQMNDGAATQTVNDITSTNNDGYPGTSTSAESSDPASVIGCMCTTAASIASGGNTVICTPTGITLTSNSGAGLTYQWRRDGNEIINATSSTYTTLIAGKYTCRIINGTCGNTSNAITLTRNSPTVSITGGALAICTGSSTTFSTNVTNGGTPVYQWQLNGVNIAGATLSSINATQQGTYNVVVTNTTNGCSANAQSTVFLTVHTSVPISTISYINDSSNCTSVGMQVTGGLSTGYTYQWQKNSVTISGQQNYIYNAVESGVYKCVVTNSCGSSNTNGLSPLVVGTGNITVIGSTSFCSGSVLLQAPSSVQVYNIAGFQWYLNNWPIEGAITPSYSATGAGSYTCKIYTAQCGPIESNNSIVINGAPVIYPSGPLEVCSGEDVYLNAWGGSTATSYQWKLNGNIIPGQTATTLVTSIMGNYTCDVTSTQCGTISSNMLTALTGNPQVRIVFPPEGQALSSCGNDINYIAIEPQSFNTSIGIFEESTSTPQGWVSSNNQYYQMAPQVFSGSYYVTLNNGCGTSSSLNIAGTEGRRAQFIHTEGYHYVVSTMGNNICTGNSTVLKVAPQPVNYSYGPDWSNYAWKFNGSPVAGGSQATLNITPSQTGWYSCTVSNLCGTASHVDSVQIKVSTPAIATVTANGPLTFCQGQSVTFTVASNPFSSFTWYKNNSPLGATGSSYTATTAGTYKVRVSNSCGAADSPNQVVTIGGTPTQASITGSTTFCAGLSNILTANTGAGITYQWYRNGVAQSGAVSSTFNANSNGTYYVIETSSCGTSQSNNMVVTQINNPNPAISYNTPLSFCSPGNVVLTSNTFSGVQYQWQKNSTDIAGATLQNYTATSNGSYRVRQTANGCYKYSPAINTTTAMSVTATITANGPVTFCTGGSVVLSVSNAIPSYGYQWKKNNINISNATQSSYTATTAGSYTCAVTASCGSAVSNVITVSTGGITASITPSGSISICSGATAALNANTGSGYNYQWKLNGTNITGATSSVYNATIAGSYTVAITSPCGNATSVATTVSISNVTATITPAGTTVICAGLGQTFTANSGFNYSYQWYRNGVAQAGSTTQTYSNSSNGSYTVKITQGASCSATSAAAILSVTNNPTPVITAGGPTTFCVGQNVTLTANTFAGVQLQWQKNSTDIAGATNTNYTATTTGAYRVKQTANGCYKTSPTIAVTVNCRTAGDEIKSETKNELVVYPNPFRNELTVYGIQLMPGDKIQMINMLGEVVRNEKVVTSTNSYQMKVENIKSGIYFMQVITSAEKRIVKVVK